MHRERRPAESEGRAAAERAARCGAHCMLSCVGLKAITDSPKPTFQRKCCMPNCGRRIARPSASGRRWKQQCIWSETWRCSRYISFLPPPPSFLKSHMLSSTHTRTLSLSLSTLPRSQVLTLQTASNEKQKEDMRKLKEQEAELLVRGRPQSFFILKCHTHIIYTVYLWGLM